MRNITLIASAAFAMPADKFILGSEHNGSPKTCGQRAEQPNLWYLNNR